MHARPTARSVSACVSAFVIGTALLTSCGNEQDSSPAPQESASQIATEPTFDTPLPSSGTYVGSAVQQDGQNSANDIRFDTKIIVDGRSLKIEYPTLQCAGVLTQVGEDSGAPVFRQDITVGSCFSEGGFWTVGIGSDRTMSSRFIPFDNSYYMIANLNRA